MKTAVSIPDELFAEAERTARRLGFNRSQLYARAIEAYLAIHEDDPVTAKLDQIADELDTSAGIEGGRDLIETGAWEW